MTTSLDKVILHLRAALRNRPGAELNDGQLLENFISRRDTAGLEALVVRHGPMVWGVCRRLLHDHHDAEDAFQATFLVLVRKAASVSPKDMVGNWLYGVACQTALKARATSAKRRTRERPLHQFLEPAAKENSLWRDLQPVLDLELRRLPDKYRVAVVLCDLQGKTRKEAAAQLGCPEGTLAAQLARGRVMLAKRLARHGCSLSGGALAVVLSQQSASASLASVIVSSTIKAATLLAAGSAATNGLVPANVAAITNGVLQTMFLTKFKSTIAVLFVLGTTLLGIGGLYPTTRATEPSTTQEQASDDPDELRDQVADLKKQFQQLQKKIARLEQDSRTRSKDPEPRFDSLAARFKYRIDFETGPTEGKEIGHIEIKDIWGTRPHIEVGGQYIVRGSCKLPAGERGKIYFNETAARDWNQTSTLDLQMKTVDEKDNEFELVHGMAGPGQFHLYLADPKNYSRCFANVYFSSKDQEPKTQR